MKQFIARSLGRGLMFEEPTEAIIVSVYDRPLRRTSQYLRTSRRKHISAEANRLPVLFTTEAVSYTHLHTILDILFITICQRSEK